MDSLSSAQAALRAEVAEQKAVTAAVAEDVRQLRTWVISDVVAKLQA